MHRRFLEFYHLLRTIPKAIAFYQGSPRLALQRAIGVWRREGTEGVKRRMKILLGGLMPAPVRYQGLPDIQARLPDSEPCRQPKVSIIVPNYNHARYLRQRLETVYGQSYRNIEVILLDDHSTDFSVAILQEYAQRYPSITICHFNDRNSGGVFQQWRRGFELATGDLVWIAESDDYATPDFLEKLVGFFRHDAVRLAFCRTDFVSGESEAPTWSSEAYLADLHLDAWQAPFITTAHALVKSAWVVKNVIPNVSAALFRHPRDLPLLQDAQWADLRLCGDWIFYLAQIRGGLVAYTPEATNYYRQHPSNTSVNAQKEQRYYREHQTVCSYLAQLYKLEHQDFERHQRHLYQHWCNRYGDLRGADFAALFALEEILPLTARRKPNVVMCVYALVAGGGETFPITLANLLSEQGHAVTLFNCHEVPTEPGVRAMLSPQVTLLELKYLHSLASVLNVMGTELVHSHHAWVDTTVATLLAGSPDIAQVVTMHGMYEMMPPEQLQQLLPLLTHRIDRFVYIAEKNLQPFDDAFRQAKGFCRIPNALPIKAINPVSRADLAIGEDDFVLCLVSRAIAEKGWQEAVEAVQWANARSVRRTHLLLVGDGPEEARLQASVQDDCIHLLGFRANTRDYFATANMGLLPSRFAGESFPLVLIDCLLAGKPVLASNLGEIPFIVDSPVGLAGELFDLEDGAIDIEALGARILRFASDPQTYAEALACVPHAAEKFDATRMAEQYANLYAEVLARLENV